MAKITASVVLIQGEITLTTAHYAVQQFDTEKEACSWVKGVYMDTNLAKGMLVPQTHNPVKDPQEDLDVLDAFLAAGALADTITVKSVDNGEQGQQLKDFIVVFTK